MSASAVNRLLARLFQEPELLARLQGDRQAVFREAGLSEEECGALEEGTFAALERIHVHPILRMHYQMAINPEIAGHVTVKPFLAALAEEQRHG